MPSSRESSLPADPFAWLVERLDRLEGRAGDLRWAVFEQPDEPLPLARQRAGELLWSALPPPCRLLEVGIGQGATLARLAAAGYQALGISPDAAEVARARQHQGDALPVACAGLVDWPDAAGEWQALLFQESTQSIEALALFSAAERLLTRGPATLVVIDEFALRRDDDSHAGPHLLPHFIAMAARFGWRLVQQTDLSSAVQPTLQHLLRSSRELRPRLQAELALDAPGSDALELALGRRQRLYREAVFGYALLRFERQAAAAEQLLPVDAAHAAAMRGLFAEVFGHPLSEAEWRWKYGDGHGQALALVQDGRWVAHYGGLTRAVLDRGEPALACQVCDVMVHADARATLARRGPLHKVTAAFLETQIGWGLKHRFGFGFPTDRAFGIAERLGLYAATDRLLCASWLALDDLPAPRGPVQALSRDELATGSLAEREVNALWQAMAGEFSGLLLGVRDARWLSHRYACHPRFEYELLLLRTRWWRRPLGVVVLRRHEEHLEWVDVVAPTAAWPALLRFVRVRAARLGLLRVDAWITESQQGLFDTLAHDVSWRPLGIDIPANAHSPGPAIDEQRGRWLLMAGDTDFR